MAYSPARALTDMVSHSSGTRDDNFSIVYGGHSIGSLSMAGLAVSKYEPAI